ncbi:MAG: DinB family protein [Armatimonadetes bacterium]|nr:DinB family protein [Armatimonadota bacterium]
MDPVVETCKKSAVDGMNMFLRNFAHVPDDKLNFQVTPTAKSPLRIAAHTALYMGRFAAMMRDRKLPSPVDLDAWLKLVEAEETAITTREDMEKAFRAGTDEVLAVLDSLTPEDLEFAFDSGLGFSFSMRQMMALPGWHATLHTGQIDFLQTCWGDQHVHLS